MGLTTRTPAYTALFLGLRVWAQDAVEQLPGHAESGTDPAIVYQVIAVIVLVLLIVCVAVIVRLMRKTDRTEDALEKTASELKDREIQFLTLAEGSPVGIFIIQDGRFRYVNSKLAQIFKYSKSELMEEVDPNALISLEDRPGLMAYERESLSGEIQLDGYEFRGITKRGERINAAFFGSSVAFSGRQALLGSVIDLTHREQEEEERQKRRNLESLGLLAGGIAHDFNNLLSVILGNVSLLRSAPLSSVQEKYLSSLEEATKEAGVLTRKLNSFSKAEPVSKECVYLNEVMGRVVESQSDVEGLIAVDIDIPFDLEAVCGDGEQLWQVFSNILTNARQAIHRQGHIRIKANAIELEEENAMQLPPGPYITVSISDTGGGIPKAALPKVFDPYFSTREIGHRGMGLGLTVAYAIILKHGGNIRLLSEINKGTTVEVTLPAWTEPEPVAAFVAAPDAAAETAAATEPRQTRVLFMDDEESILLVNEDYLDLQGYVVSTAREGGQALEAYKQAMDSGRPFDVVVLDIVNYRGMGGKETLAELTKIDPNVKAIAISGYLSDSDMEALLDLGFKRLLRKPYDMHHLHQLLTEVLADKSS